MKTTGAAFPRGSTWRRWDLHVHTPASALESNFNDWDTYVAALEEKGKGVAVLGVTDYFSIDGYKRLLEYREQGRLAAFDLLVPNIEVRTHPETSDGKGINIHILVSPIDSNHVLEIDSALAKLNYSYKGKQYSCTRADLIRLGRAHETTIVDDEVAFRHGVNQFKPDFTTFRDWFFDQGWLRENSLVAMANGKDGPSGLSKDAGFKATREELYRFAQVIFSGKPADRKYFLGEGSDAADEVIRKNGSLKPCVHGSDAHDEEKLFEPDMQRYCWIKADPTFEGLRQTLYEPADRVHIGATPPTAIDDSKVIAKVSFHDATHWFPQTEIELNSGLVAIIGEKGSGKTALADLIAYGADAWEGEESSSSFINKAKPHLEGVGVQLHWASGAVNPVRGLPDHNESGDLPGVRYLSQDFVEELCSMDTSGDALVREIEKVVFNHVDASEQLGASDFTELRRLRTEHLTQRRDKLRARITTLNSEIVRLEDLLASRAAKVKQLEQVKGGAAAIKKQLPALQSTVNKEVAEKLDKERLAAQAATANLADINRKLSKIPAARDAIKDFFDDIEQRYGEIRTLLQEIGVSEDVIRKLRPTFAENVEAPLGVKEQEFIAAAAALKGDSRKPQKDGITIADILSRIVALEKTLAEDEKERVRLLKLQSDEAKLRVEQTKIENEIKDIDDAHTPALVSKREERWSTYLEHFDVLSEEATALRDLYRPIDLVLADEKVGAKAEFELSVERTSDVSSWLEAGRSLIDERQNSPLKNIQERTKELEASLRKAWASDDKKEIRKVLDELLTKLSDSGLDGLLLARTSRGQFYNWFFSLDHLTNDYNLRYGGTELTALSPGTRGIVLLVLYLEMDKQDRRPLLIDQPEGNLDNSSIYGSLVPYLRRAKMERQIILLTHNPNLVVTTDADQVIVARMERQVGQAHPILRYKSGSLEDVSGEDSIRESVCKLLEGGRDAFRARENRYAMSAR